MKNKEIKKCVDKLTHEIIELDDSLSLIRDELTRLNVNNMSEFIKAKKTVEKIFKEKVSEWIRDKILNSDKLTTSYLQEQHPELTDNQLISLLDFCKTNTITHIECYGDGEIMFKKWFDYYVKGMGFQYILAKCSTPVLGICFQIELCDPKANKDDCCRKFFVENLKCGGRNFNSKYECKTAALKKINIIRSEPKLCANCHKRLKTVTKFHCDNCCEITTDKDLLPEEAKMALMKAKCEVERLYNLKVTITIEG